MSGTACQAEDARRRILGGPRAEDPPYPKSCSGSTAWHNFPTTDSGDAVPFFLCERHRQFIREARTARIGH
ncbi:MAG TPA: hypothetical protein VMG81_03930 [Thermoplasmata archaeon]|nr:hypothetical protein [Thermoplasmata archaeon]